MPVIARNGCCYNADQHLVVRELRLLDVSELEDFVG
jgi:hypothetical protein